MDFLPPWAGDAPVGKAWTLEVTKHDQHVGSLQLARACSVVGRKHEHADIVVDHQSVSRKHAALFHGQDSKLYVVCLGSSHGTTLNSDEALIKHQPIEVRPGDVLRFGKSSKLYTATLAQAPRADGSGVIEQSHRNNFNAIREVTASSKPLPGATAAFVLAAPQVDEGEDEDSSDDDFGPSVAPCRAPHSGGEAAIVCAPSKHTDDSQDAVSGASAPTATSPPLQALALQYRVPISHEISLEGHSKGLPCLSVELTGNRVVTCSRDASLQIFDFGGMDSTHRAFRVLTPLAGIGINFIAHSTSGDRFAVASGNSQPLVYSREGVELLKFCKGDMYIRDLSHTKGHTTETTCICWHPTLKDAVLSGSQDGTLRSWDLNSTLHFNMLQCKDVFKVKSAQGTFARTGVFSCTYSFDGKLAVAGCADGSVHIWDVKLVTRAKAILRPLGKDANVAITSVVTVPYELSTEAPSTTLDSARRRAGGGILACRAQSGEVFIYMLKNIHAPNAQPFRVLRGCTNSSVSANIAFSPDAGIVCVPTSMADGASKDSAPARLCFFQTEDANEEVVADVPCLQIGLDGVCGASYVSWLASTQQIFVATSGGSAKVYFDPRISRKGAMLSSSRAPPRRTVDSIDTARIVEQAYVASGGNKRSRGSTLAPSAPPSQARVPEGSTAFQKTQFVMQGSTFANPRAEDPREVLLAYSSKEGIGQPASVLAATTIEHEQEQEAKRRKAAN